jgi:hypothetical protein
MPSRPHLIGFALATGAAALAALWLFPPLTTMGRTMGSPTETYGYRFTERDGTVLTRLVVNERKLAFQQAAILSVTVLLAFSIQKMKKKE